MNGYKLAVIPSDPLEAYKKKGIASKLEGYFNPLGFFSKIYVLSPLEPEDKIKYGMRIIPVKDTRLPAKLQELDIDIIRAYGGNWPCDMACNYKIRNVPVVVSVHDRRPEWLHHTIKKADIVFAVSEEVKELVAKRGVDPNLIWVLPNRVDLNIMRPLDKDNFKDLTSKYGYRYKVLHIGRKSEEKNLDKIIRALKILGAEYCLIAVGQGDESKYRQIAESEGVSDRVYFLTQVNNQELPAYYSFTDCLCNPSTTEAMSSVLVEAMACGTAIITSEIAARGVGLKDGEDSLILSDHNDPLEIADLVGRVCSDIELKSRLELGARESARKYDKIRIDSLEAEYYQRIMTMKETGIFKRNNIQLYCDRTLQRILKFVRSMLKREISADEK